MNGFVGASGQTGGNALSQQAKLDSANATFWDELCGTSLARSLGISTPSTENLARFDRAYFEFYPYLRGYFPDALIVGKRVLEVGLGYGTLGAALGERAAEYVGVDIAEGPVQVAKARQRMMNRIPGGIIRGTALGLPFPDKTFDVVATIGCLHHTGNLIRAIGEVHRVLRTNGRAIVMLYNRRSFRRVVLRRWWSLRERLRRASRSIKGEEGLRALYDSNAIGQPAPHTEFLSRAEARSRFSAFRNIRIQSQNFDDLAILRGRLFIPRARSLGTLGRMWGLDLYISVTK